MMSMRSTGALWVLMCCCVAWTAAAALPNGMYARRREELITNDVAADEGNVRQTMLRPANNNGMMMGATDQRKGQYVPSDDGKYVHVSDRRERGKYVHIPFPYDGGYGPYDGLNGLPYEYDPAGDYSFDKFQTTRATTRRTPSPRPRRTYDDEGRWKILRQNEKKQPKKYEYMYETENGIYAQEHAVVGMKHSDTAGTRGEGFYQYIGDDDRIYRVEYTVGEQGYQPKLIIMDNPLSNRTTKAPRTTKTPSWKQSSPTRTPSTFQQRTTTTQHKTTPRKLSIPGKFEHNTPKPISTSVTVHKAQILKAGSDGQDLKLLTTEQSTTVTPTLANDDDQHTTTEMITTKDRNQVEDITHAVTFVSTIKPEEEVITNNDLLITTMDTINNVQPDTETTPESLDLGTTTVDEIKNTSHNLENISDITALTTPEELYTTIGADIIENSQPDIETTPESLDLETITVDEIKSTSLLENTSYKSASTTPEELYTTNDDVENYESSSNTVNVPNETFTISSMQAENTSTVQH